jgi:two-component system, chemotaxis family, chemotaxis protein CheY
MQIDRAVDIKQRLRSLRVLIVDDNAFMRNIVRDLLATIGVRHTAEAADGVAALQVLRQDPPDVVILDWDMPFLNGFELARIVRAPGVFPHPDVPIIMLSGCGRRSLVLEAERLGINEFLAKPVSAKALFHRIVAVLTQQRTMVQVDGCYRPERRTHAWRAALPAS